jgi:succinate dehydrogenase / fumarate reductase membrane anchor subunit
LVNLFLGTGVRAIDFAFVAGKWASPFWQLWDVLMLWLALIHGGNGMRTVINDYARGRLRPVLLILVAAAVVVLIVLGTLVLTTFDPCPAGAPANLVPDFCSAISK